MRKNRHKALIGWIIGGSIIVCIAMPFILDKFVFGNNIESNLNNSEWSSFLGSYIGGIVGGVATLVAVIISLNISKNIQAQSELKENSLIVYYDLILGITDLKRIYINHKNKAYKNVPSRMFFSNEWIKNVARTSGTLEDKDKMYKLYGDLEMVSQEIESKSHLEILDGLDGDYNNDRFDKIIESISNKYFTDEFRKGDMKIYSDNEDIVLDIEKDIKDDTKKVIMDLKSNVVKYIK